MSTITITARELTALVASVIPHASKDETLPLLCSVFVRSSGPWVTALTTDRYRMAFQRIRPTEAPGDGFAAIIPLGVLARIRATFKAGRNMDPVITLTVDGEKLTVTTTGALDGMVGASFEFRLHDPASAWPNVDRLLTGALDAEVPTGPTRMLVNPSFLADFRLGQSRYDSMRVTPTGGDRKPWLIRIGEDFIGLIVPLHSGSSVEIAPAERDGWLGILTVRETATKVAA
jgi:hypothetical protein